MSNFLQLVKFNAKLALSALVSVVLIRLLLWMVPFRILNRILGNRKRGEGGEPRSDRARRLRIASAVSISSRLVPAASCLTQAFATKLLLRSQGDDAELCFGAARSPAGAFEAHAWLERDGEIIIGALPELDRYHRLSASVPCI